MIFVFGSNESGIHGAGAAEVARLKHGARSGQGFGPAGNSFAIPTKDWDIRSLAVSAIQAYVTRFIAYTKLNSDLKFKITQIGCGLAGFKSEQIAPLFLEASTNCYFDEAWSPWLDNTKNYWGTYA